jgi:hypothetical protein
MFDECLKKLRKERMISQKKTVRGTRVKSFYHCTI